MDELIKSFSVIVYGDVERFNEVTSKARCRIFYKGANRNGTYITDEFAEKLIGTIPYTPVKGIYDGEDYTDHGMSRQLGRIYGIVPENPNFSWETHMDEDGIEREYACVDVLLFTALYAEAGDIIGKAQSMELYDKSIQGEWIIMNGQKYYQFTDGCFLGLQVLGEGVEPCFEGAAFFSLCESLTDMIHKIEEYNLNLNNRQGGEHAMPAFNYKLSDSAKFDALWSLLNVNYTEEGNWTVEYDICAIYDDYAVVKNYSENCFERVYYIKNDETDSVSIENRKKCHMLDVTEDELAALNALKALNNSTYEKVDELYTNAQAQIETLTQEKTEFEQKIGEYELQISTLTTEKADVMTQYEAANNLLNDTKVTLETVQASLATLESEHASLVEYKKAIEKSEKEEVIASYTALLSEEILNGYTEKIDTFTAMELDKELAYELKKANVSIFNSNSNPYIPKDTNPKSGIEEILSKYQK